MTPHWLDEMNSAYALARIASGDGPPLAAHEAQAILNDLGDLYGMLGEQIMKVRRLEVAHAETR